MRAGLVCALALALAGCTATAPEPVVPTEAEAPDVEGAAGGADDESLNPNQLTGLPGIDRAQDLDVRILDARGTGQLGGVPVVPGQVTPFPTGEWLLTEPGSEYEITLRSALLPDGIVRLAGHGALLIEPPLGALPQFRLFGGHASFYLPHLPAELTVLTPAGPLVTRGAVFTVTATPDFQVLVTCREGTVFLTGSQNAVAQPGQVLVADRLGRGRVYQMTPNEALVFTERWLKVMTEESAPVVAATLPRRLAAWNALGSRWQVEETRFTALWFRQARAVLGSAVPGPEVWSGALAMGVKPSPWHDLPAAPGLLGELP